MNYQGVLLSDEEKTKYLYGGKKFSAVNRKTLMLLRTVFKGPEEEVYRLVQYVDEQYQTKASIDNIKDGIAVTSLELAEIDMIDKFPMLKVVGFVLELDKYDRMYRAGVMYIPSGFRYPSKYERLVDCDYVASYVYKDKSRFIDYVSKSYLWPILKDPCKDFTVRYKNFERNPHFYNKPSGKQVQLNYKFPYAFEWNDNEYIYREGKDYYRVDKISSFEIEGNELKSFVGDLGKVVVPKTVQIISASAFKGNNTVNKIGMSSVEEIGNEAFANCTNLKYVELSDSLSIIGDEAFAYCDRLVELTIPDNVSSIGTGAFFKCGVGKVVWPKGVQTMPMGMFRDCRNLYEIYIPPEVITIEPRVFSRSNTVIVYGQPGSEAERYAKEYGMYFKPYEFD